MSCEHQWKAAISWVQSNHRLVGHIAAPYRRYMSSGTRDIEQEAVLAAFCALTSLTDKDEDSRRLGAYFRVQFRTRCMKLASGGMVSSFDDIDQIPTPPSEHKIKELDDEIIDQALQKMSNRQREISEWILTQPTPVSTNTVAERFDICSRTVRAILCNAVSRIQKRDYGNPRIRKDISAAA